jgi:predicted ArsR family transcriptional regulator
VLVVETHQRGTVGRPQHLYSLSDDAPALGLGPRSYHLLSELLAGLAARLARPDDAVEIGREWGRKVATLEPPLPGRRDPIDVVCAAFERLGFDPFADDDRVAFAHCPFRELAEAHPDLICSLHRGLTEGVLEAADGSASLAAFHPLHAAEPCTAVLRR